MLGQTASTVLEGDRVVAIRVKAEPSVINRRGDPPRTCRSGRRTGAWSSSSQVVDVVEEPGQLELRRDDFRQDVAVTARLEGRDLGSAMAEIQDGARPGQDHPPGVDRIWRPLPAAAGILPQPDDRPGSWPSSSSSPSCSSNSARSSSPWPSSSGRAGHVRDDPRPVGHGDIAQRRLAAGRHHRRRHRRQERHPDARFRQGAPGPGARPGRSAGALGDGGGCGPS